MTLAFRLLACGLPLAGCARSLLDRLDAPPGSDDSGPEESGGLPVDRVTTVEQGGVYTTVVDATDYLDWVYLSLATGLEVLPAAPADSLEWDLAFQRWYVMSNGGVSGTGGVQALAIEDQDFEALTQAPAEGYTTDQPDDDDKNDTPEYALGDWFAYDPEDHGLTPLPLVWVVQTVADDYQKLEFLSYYDDAGTPAWMSFRWAEVSPP